MPNANWSNPTLTSTYTNFVTEVKSRDEDLALQFDGTTATNFPTGTIRWSSSVNRWQKWSGTAWGELTATYALTGLSTTGNASIGGTLGVTGAATLSSTLGVTGAFTCSGNVTGRSFIPTAATIPTTAGMFYPAANTIGFGANGVEVARITSNGRLGIYSQAPDAQFEVSSPLGVSAAIFKSNTIEACRVDPLRRLLIGTATAIDEGSGISRLQVAGIDTGSSNILLSRFSADAETPRFTFTKSRNATVGGNTLVQNGDVLGRLEFKGANGTTYQPGAYIDATVEGTPSSTTMPATVAISTTPNGTNVPVARFSIGRSGQLSANVPGNATTTLYPGFLARAWVNFNGTGTVSIRASANVSSITDNGTGSFTVNLNNAMVDANYCVCATAKTSNSSAADTTIGQWHTLATSSFGLVSSQGNNGVLVDPVNISASIFR